MTPQSPVREAQDKPKQARKGRRAAHAMYKHSSNSMNFA